MKIKEINKLSKDELKNKFKKGDTVKIIECRPISKKKRFEVMDVKQ